MSEGWERRSVADGLVEADRLVQTLLWLLAEARWLAGVWRQDSMTSPFEAPFPWEGE